MSRKLKPFVLPGQSAHDLAGPFFLRTLYEHGGYYECPTLEDDTIVGKLVQYAGSYEPGPGQPKERFVGLQYCNLAKLESDPIAYAIFINILADNIRRKFAANGRGQYFPNRVLAAPFGGMAMSTWLSSALCIDYAFSEKKVTKVGEGGDRDQTIQVMGRHEIHEGDVVLIGEDVFNNGSTADEMRQLVEKNPATVVAIVCILNRSWPHVTDWKGIPIIAAADIPMIQFCRDEPKVAEAIERDRLELKPKDHWAQLMDYMNNAERWASCEQG